MATCIILFQWTQQGVQTIQQSPTRLDVFKELHESMGAELKGFYMTTGQYDGLMITEAPDHETAVQIALALATKGNVRTETWPAFTEDEYRNLIAAIPITSRRID